MDFDGLHPFRGKIVPDRGPRFPKTGLALSDFFPRNTGNHHICTLRQV